jgi:KDO2-lipid IV(A) lauroyltransferase
MPAAQRVLTILPQFSTFVLTFLSAMRKRLEYFFFQLFRWFVLALPLKSAQRLGYYLGGIAYRAVGGRRRIAMDNLRHAFADVPEVEIRRIAKGAFRNLAISLIELLWFPNLTESGLAKLVRIRNPESVTDAHALGKGMIFLTGHFGNWELGALAVGHLTKIPITIVVQTQNNEFVNDVVNRHRTLFGNRVVPRGVGIREIIRVLQDRGAIAIAPDQSGPMEGPYVEFFGRNVSAHQGPAVFALRTGAPMRMGFMIRQNDGTYEIVFEEIDVSDLGKYTEETMLEVTRRYTAILERYIRRYPDHWLWLHRRWKHTLPTGARKPESVPVRG